MNLYTPTNENLWDKKYKRYHIRKLKYQSTKASLSLRTIPVLLTHSHTKAIKLYKRVKAKCLALIWLNFFLLSLNTKQFGLFFSVFRIVLVFHHKGLLCIIFPFIIIFNSCTLSPHRSKWFKPETDIGHGCRDGRVSID